MYYFAYGSNMSSRRLQQRVASARMVTVATLPGHRLAFHKVSKVDYSGKCDIPKSDNPEDAVIGVVYDIDPGEKALLDDVEGVGTGYEIMQIDVIGETDKTCSCFTYYATRIDKSLKPYHWYKEHVLRGAIEHQLPATYVAWLKRVDSIRDPDARRTQAQLAIYELSSPA